MDVHVSFRFNTHTGQVEAFDIRDLGSNLLEAEHNREHDRLAALFGSLLERDPRILELLESQIAPVEPLNKATSENESASEPLRQNPTPERN